MKLTTEDEISTLKAHIDVLIDSITGLTMRISETNAAVANINAKYELLRARIEKMIIGQKAASLKNQDINTE
jgi:hypothetical protein